MDAYAAQFTADADFVNVVGMHWRGRHEIGSRHAEIHQTIFRHSQLQQLGHSLQFINPDTAVAHLEWRMTGHDTKHLNDWRTPEVRTGVMTIVLVRSGDTWRIRAAHNTDIIPLPSLDN